MQVHGDGVESVKVVKDVLEVGNELEDDEEGRMNGREVKDEWSRSQGCPGSQE